MLNETVGSRLFGGTSMAAVVLRLCVDFGAVAAWCEVRRVTANPVGHGRSPSDRRQRAEIPFTSHSILDVSLAPPEGRP